MTTDGGSAAVVRRRVSGIAVAAVALAVVGLGLAAKPAPLEAVATYPAAGAVLDGSPGQVWVSLRGAARPREFHIAVSHRDGGVPVATAAARLEGQNLVATVPVLPAGEYLMGYHVVLADGRQISGLSPFTVGAAGGPPPPAAAPPAGHAHGGKDPVTGALLVLNIVLIGLVTLLFLRRRRRPSARSAA